MNPSLFDVPNANGMLVVGMCVHCIPYAAIAMNGASYTIRSEMQQDKTVH